MIFPYLCAKLFWKAGGRSGLDADQEPPHFLMKFLTVPAPDQVASSSLNCPLVSNRPVGTLLRLALVGGESSAAREREDRRARAGPPENRLPVVRLHVQM